MVLELFSTVLLDGAGAKARENSDKKKLKEAEGDPERPTRYSQTYREGRRMETNSYSF